LNSSPPVSPPAAARTITATLAKIAETMTTPLKKKIQRPRVTTIRFGAQPNSLALGIVALPT
jgi:hypothetical protein